MILASLTALGMFLVPYATVTRNFSGASTILLFPLRVLDYTGFIDQLTLPATILPYSLSGIAWGLLWVAAGFAYFRSPRLWLVGALGVLFSLGAIVSYQVNIQHLIDVALSQNMPLRRIPYTSATGHLGLWSPLLTFSIITTIGWVSALKLQTYILRLRSIVVPILAILLSLLVGGIIVLILQAVPNSSNVPLDYWEIWIGKIDLLWFTYTTIFSPLVTPADLFQSLMLATPLIFTGLSVMIAFRAGLFNIGAAGQLTIGAICASMVGIYAPLPPILLMPATVLAAAIGGGLWGALAGLLKARFGSSEVITTIMLNYIAASCLVLLISSNEVSFFGQTYHWPFKAEGYEAKSLELQVGAHFPTLTHLFGLDHVGGFIPTSPLLGLAVAALVAWRLRSHIRRWLWTAAAGVVTTAVMWFPMILRYSPGLADSHLNISLFVAILSAIGVGVYLWRTSGGFGLRVTGLSPKAAEYGGISVNRNIIWAMFLAGALAGLAATHYVQGGVLDEYRLKQSLPTGVGFDGITIALLGQIHPIGIMLASLFFGMLDTSSLYIDQKLDSINRDIVTVLKALILIFIATEGFIGHFLRHKNPPGDGS